MNNSEFQPVHHGQIEPPKKSSGWKWGISILVALALLWGLGTAIDSRRTVETDTVAAEATTTTATPTTTVPQLTDADREKYGQQARERAAEAARQRAAAEAARLDPNTYEWISERDFALIAKNPSTAVGRKIVLFGRVYQFDSATGTGAFLAYTEPVQGNSKYDYDQNTWVNAHDPTILEPVVEDDIVKMYVEVKGAYSYDTQIGGNTTVPEVTVNIIEVVG
ncbi:DUF2510 domain-containing protein [Rhodococcus aetherivorans]|uniref:DUF2510 domain-containing protein n=1 Tax=Rhodococcus aetherivorans TaxID=191292 RepID=UPI001E4B49A1|nr:DUF2510 domain-containing protein [Rhodococcus aetherivorans]UGQ41220.1 DUF2510 domain-containing protein [Rhodococcus aetherivorans]